jgi:NADH-quinone oxidoreductase subunit M
MIRFLVPLFPDAALDFQTIVMAIAVVSILYGAVVAFSQTDIKRLVAYTSVSHMGFVLLGIFAWNELALQGAVMIMLAHAMSTGALFIIVGDLQQRIHTREISEMEGLWATIPKMSGIALFFAIASLGLPGLGNFVGEFLVVLGAYQSNLPLAVLATLGLIVSAVYSLWMVQAVFQGQNIHQWKLPDITRREAAILVTMAGMLLWLGLYPKTVLSTARDSIHNLQQSVSSSQAQPPESGDTR